MSNYKSTNKGYSFHFTQQNDFRSGTLPSDSFIRPSRIFTADKSIIIRKAGIANGNVIAAVIKKIIDIIQ